MSLGINTNYSNYNTYSNRMVRAQQPTKSSGDSSSKTVDETSYLQKLQESYPSLNFTVGNDSKGTGCTGFGNVTLHPNLVRKMENDPELAAKIENDIKYIPQAESWLKGMTASGGGRLKASGCFIDEDGNMSSWSVAEYGATKEQVKKEEEEELRKKALDTKRAHEKALMDKFMANHTEQRTMIEGSIQTTNANLYAKLLFSSQAQTTPIAVNLNVGDE